METMDWMLLGLGLVVGTGAAVTGLGGGFLIIPILLYAGFTAQRAVGTSFLAILIIAVSALIAHQKLNNIDVKAGLLLGVGGVVGAQIGARVLEHIPTLQFRRIFAVILIALAVSMLVKR